MLYMRCGLYRGPVPEHPREGNGNPLQYYCLENSKDRGAWWAIVCEILKKVIQMNLFKKQKKPHRFKEQIYSYQGKMMEGRDRLGVWY